MVSSYSPFTQKETTDIDAADLSTLRTVREGWYVEYKRDLPNSRSIAKAVSAFANTYGGWLFIGVDEDQGDPNTAGMIPGISRGEVDTTLQFIQQSVNSHINPVPHFDMVPVWGPNEEIGLADDHCVVCIHTRQSPNAPHVHSNGVIYRRIAESSEPKSETDRYQLELLWRRRDTIHAEYKTWIERAPEFSTYDQKKPFVRVLLDADPYGESGLKWDLSTTQVNEALSGSLPGIALGIDSVFPSSMGIVARQTSSLDRHQDFGATLVVCDKLRFEFWLPINCLLSGSDKRLRDSLSHYLNVDKCIEILQTSKATSCEILDLSALFINLSAAISMFEGLLKKAAIEPRCVRAKVILENVLQKVALVDSETLLQQIEDTGLPICLTNKAMMPNGLDADSFFEIPELKVDVERAHPSMSGFYSAIWAFELTCMALGWHGIVKEGDPKEQGKGLLELVEAWQRSLGDSTRLVE